MKWFILAVLGAMCILIGANAVALVSVFGSDELVRPPVVFLVGIFVCSMVMMLALARWVTLRDQAVFDWRIIAGRRPSEPVLSKAWTSGAVALIALGLIAVLIVAFVLVR